MSFQGWDVVDVTHMSVAIKTEEPHTLDMFDVACSKLGTNPINSTAYLGIWGVGQPGMVDAD